MDFIFDNIKIFIFIGAGVLWLLGQISEIKKKQQQEQQQPWNPPDDEGYDDGYDPEPRHMAVPPPLPRAGTPPALSVENGELARQRTIQERLKALRQERAAVIKAAGRKTAGKKSQPLSSTASLKTRLRHQGELRRAIVMREILDPPVGLR